MSRISFCVETAISALGAVLLSSCSPRETPPASGSNEPELLIPATGTRPDDVPKGDEIGAWRGILTFADSESAIAAAATLKARFSDFPAQSVTVTTEFDDRANVVVDVAGILHSRVQSAELAAFAKGEVSFYLVRLDGEGEDSDASLFMELTDTDGTPLQLWPEPVIDGSAIQKARIQRDLFGKWVAILELTEVGTAEFSQITGANIGRRIAVTLDGRILTAPTINGQVTGGTAAITGQGFHKALASALASVISAGALPSAPLSTFSIFEPGNRTR